MLRPTLTAMLDGENQYEDKNQNVSTYHYDFIAEDLLKAIRVGDKQAMITALKFFIQMCVDEHETKEDDMSQVVHGMPQY
jgi:hypothetical protein